MVSTGRVPFLLAGAEVEAVFVGKAAVGGGDHALSRFEPAEHFDEVVVAPAELDLTLGRAVVAGIDDENPRAAGVAEERAVRNQQRLGRISYGQLCLNRLSALNRPRLLPDEHQIDLELAVADLRIDL